jgi:RHS repeat-associated protein
MEGKKETKEVQNLLGLEGNVILAERAVKISGEPTSEGGTSGEKAEDGAASEETKNRNFDYYLYNKDVQGSTTSILDEDGAGELSYEYDDFGETEINGNSVFQNEICYTGGIYDETTGLYYLNARYYDPENGRFLTEDTYRGELNEPDTLHLYVYCKNNPINYVDPSGHKFFGFWNNKQKYFAFNQDAPQKYFGYYDIYDYAAKYFAMDLVTRKFETKHWKLQFWKGKYGKMYGYGISSGCEIGLYYKSGRLCKCAYQKERMIRMSMTLYKVGYGKAMFSRDSNSTTKSKKAWWLTAFQPAQYMPGKKAVGGRQLIMKGTIYFNTSSSKYRSSLLALGKEFNKKARFGKRPGEKFTVGGNGSKKTFTWER